MRHSDPGHVTRLLKAWNQGDKAALEAILPMIRDELMRVARGYMARERPSHTLQPTALVHEAYLKLIDQREVTWQDRCHFFGVAATLMRRVLVDHARKHHAEKRGGAVTHVTLNEEIDGRIGRDVELIDLDRALERLQALDARQAHLVELRFFAGLTVEQTAVVLGVSPATVKREWASARAWLFRELASS